MDSAPPLPSALRRNLVLGLIFRSRFRGLGSRCATSFLGGVLSPPAPPRGSAVAMTGWFASTLQRTTNDRLPVQSVES